MQIRGACALPHALRSGNTGRTKPCALSPDLAGIIAVGFKDAGDLEDDGRERLIAFFLQHTLMKDTLYHQFLDGVLPEDVWRAQELVTVGLLNCEAYRRVWDAGLIPVTDEFKEYVETLRADLPVESWTYRRTARIFE